MNILPFESAAINAAPNPVRTDAPAPNPPRTKDRFPVAYRACRQHPAFRDTDEIQKEIVKLAALCQRFAATYTPETMSAFLATLGIDCDELSDDFELVHENVVGALWFLNTLRGSICPSLVVPFDMGTASAAPQATTEGGAA